MALSVKSRIRLPGAGASAAGRAVPPFGTWLRKSVAARWQRAVRSRILPAGLRAQLTLSRGELILAVAYDPDGGCALVATDRALHHRSATGGWSRLGWELLADVVWDATGDRLVVAGLGGAAPPQTVIRLRDCGTLPELAAERIAHTRLGSWTVLLDGQGGVAAEARRRPVTGELLWIVSGRDGLDLSDRQVRGQVDEAIAQLREELGIPHPASAGRGLPDGTVS